jgi:hypothetical protein
MMPKEGACQIPGPLRLEVLAKLIQLQLETSFEDLSAKATLQQVEALVLKIIPRLLILVKPHCPD